MILASKRIDVDFESKDTCDRCHRPTTGRIMSFFNTDMICTDCATTEKAHPDYEIARDAEVEQCKAGNYNFEGIGLPNDLRRQLV